MTLKRAVAALAICAATLLSGCGGGGGGGGGTGGGGGGTTQPLNNWDAMIWDQGKWQ